jgi:hypothetical protein
MALTVLEMARQYLVDNGYDGLFSGDGECACSIDDLCPCCADPPLDCEAGFKQPCDCGDPDHEFHIGEEKS